MRERVEPSASLRELANLQGGVVTRSQAQALGLGRNSQHRLIQQGRWRILTSGVLLTHDQPPTWTAMVWAGVLKAGSQARAAGMAAAHLHRLIDEEPDQIDILQPHGYRRVPEGRWIFHQERAGVRRARSIGDPPRTQIDDTVIDLCATGLGAAVGDGPLHWISLAFQRDLTTHDRLLEALNRRSRITGRRELEQLLGAAGDGVHSPLEFYYRRDVERAHGLPRGTRQMGDRIGGRQNRRDVRYEGYRVLVELDGHTGHSGLGRFRDFRRDNAALLAGEVTLRYGWHDVRQQCCPVAFQVAEMLIRGGWNGYPTRCPHCPPGGVDGFWL